MFADSFVMLSNFDEVRLSEIGGEDTDLMALEEIIPTLLDEHSAGIQYTDQVCDFPQKSTSVEEPMRTTAKDCAIPLFVQTIQDDEQQLNDLQVNDDFWSFDATIASSSCDVSSFLSQPATFSSPPSYVGTSPTQDLMNTTVLSPSIFINDQSVPRSFDQGCATTSTDSGTGLPRYDYNTVDEAVLLPATVTAANVAGGCQLQPQEQVYASSTQFGVSATASGARQKRGRPIVPSKVVADRNNDKYERRKDQNRRAAEKCRKKRREEFDNLKKNFDRVVKDNETYKSEVKRLQDILTRLEGQLVLHNKVCGLNTTPRRLS